MGSSARHSTGRKATPARKGTVRTSPPSSKPPAAAKERKRAAHEEVRRADIASDLYEICEGLDLVVDVVQTVYDSLSAHEDTDHIGLTLGEHALEPLIKARDALRAMSKKERAK